MIAAVVARLTGQAGLKLVEGAISYAAVQVQPPDGKMPAAYVVELSEAFSPARGMSGAINQDGVASIGVILWMNAVRVDKAVANTALETLRQAVVDRLFGWDPRGDGVALHRGGGRLLYAADNLVVYQLTFTLQTEDRT